MSQSLRNQVAALAGQLAARLELEESLGSGFLACAAPDFSGLDTLPVSRPSLPAAPSAPAAPAAGRAATVAAVSSAQPADNPAVAVSAAEHGDEDRSEHRNDVAADGEAAGQAAAPAATVSYAEVSAAAAVREPDAQRPPLLTGSPEKLAALQPVVAEALVCTRCGLCRSRRQVVFGDGSLDTELVFIGDAPGREEDLTGEPFSGGAGELFTAIIEKGMKRSRASVFLTTAVKCRPEGSRPVRPAEYAQCLPYLQRQIETIRPKALVALGAAATHALCGGTEHIEQLRGIWLEFMGLPLMPVYDINFLDRQRKHLGPKNRYDRLLWQDLQAVMHHVAGGSGAPAAPGGQA